MRNFPKFNFLLNFIYLLLIAAETAAIIFLCLYIPSFFPVATTILGMWLINLISALFVFSKGGLPETCGALTLLIVALPVAGAVICFLSRIGNKECGTFTMQNATPKNGLESAALSVCGVSGAGYDKAVYFKTGEEYFATLFKEIEKAEKRVYLEYFIFRRGKIFSQLIYSLNCARARGAEIKIIFDGVGSAFKMGRREMKRLKATGAQVRVFNRLTPFLRLRLNFRDHRKIVAIDGKVVFTGGINIADEYANIDSPYGYWKDTGVAVYGAAAEVFEGMFLSVWDGSCMREIPEKGKYRCLPFYDSPPNRSGFCENAYIAAISSAKERVHIFTPYFCAGEKLASALGFAALRGVDVRIIIPHIPDKKYAFELSKTAALPLMAKGVKFYEYTPGFMHAKSMVCDDSAYIGSYNVDFRSMRLNFECGIMFEGAVSEEIERDFWESVRLSSILKVGKVNIFRRFYRFILTIFAPLI